MKKVGCKRCGECCRNIAIPIYFPDEDMYSTFKEWADARGWKLEGRFLVIPSECSNLWFDDLVGSYECAIHGHKPSICRQFPTSEDWLPPGCVYAR